MIKVTGVNYGFGDKELYEDMNFEIESGDHAALIGSNGTGKSTLLDMIINTDDYIFEGKIIKKENIRIGYISQFVKHDNSDMTVYDYLARPFLDILAKSDELCARMADENEADMDSVFEEYQKITDKIDLLDVYNYDSNIRKELATADITELADSSVNKLSGGEYKLISIIKDMLLKPELLIMDEPDAFLDFSNIVGLMKLINSYDGSLLTVTHNRLLLAMCFNKILHLENRQLQQFPGTFAAYNDAMLETKVAMKEQATKDEEWIDSQQKLVERLRKEATRIDNPTLGKQLKARVTYLERLQERKCKNPFIEEYDYDFDFNKEEIISFESNSEELNQEEAQSLDIKLEESSNVNSNSDSNLILELKDYSLTFDRPILENVTFRINKGDKVAIVGDNGTGKSSLLNDIFAELSREDKEDKVGFFRQIYDDDSTTLSGGERNIAKLKELKELGADILLLDEPTSHLDTYAQIALEDAIRAYKGTAIMVSHDFYTVANCADRIFMLKDKTLIEMSARGFRKQVYKRYFDSDVFEEQKKRRERELRINSLLASGKYKEAKECL